MTQHVWSGTATALSSIVHGGESAGTIRYLRRERFLTPDGPVDVPVVSGNALRGVLRRVSATLLWEALGRPELTLPVAHALYGGGALVKAKGEPVTGARWARLRETVPHVGVFGAAGGGRLLPGVLQVGKLVPVVSELDYLHARSGVGAAGVSAWDITQVEEYSKVADTPTVLTAASSAVPAGEVSTRVDTEADHDDRAVDDPAGLRWGVETFITGTRFGCWFTLRNATVNEVRYFHEVLRAWQRGGGLVGGMNRIGHGQLQFDPDGAGPSPAVDLDAGWDMAGASVDEVVSNLSWLD